MKNTLLLLLVLLGGSVFAQQQEQPKDTIIFEYKPRYYPTVPCGCPVPKAKDTATVKKDLLELSTVVVLQKKPKALLNARL